MDARPDFLNLAAAWKDIVSSLPDTVPDHVLGLIQCGFYQGANAVVIIQHNIMDKYGSEEEAGNILYEALCNEILQFRNDIPCSI